MMNVRKFIGVNWKSSSTGNEIQDLLPRRDLKFELQSEEGESFTKRWNQQNKGQIVNYVPERGVAVVVVFQNWTPQKKCLGKNYTPFAILLWKTYPHPFSWGGHNSLRPFLDRFLFGFYIPGFVEGHFRFFFANIRVESVLPPRPEIASNI